MRTSSTMQHDSSGILYLRNCAGDLRRITFKSTDSKSSLSALWTDASSSTTKTTPLWASSSIMTHTQHRYGSLYSALPGPLSSWVRRVTKITHLRLYCDKQSLATGPEGGPSCRQLLFLNTFSGPEYHMLVTGVRRRELACFVTASCFSEVGGGSLTSAALTVLSTGERSGPLKAAIKRAPR